MKLFYGIITIIIGLGAILYTYKNPNKWEFSEGINSPDFAGYGMGLLFFVGGCKLIKTWLEMSQ